MASTLTLQQILDPLRSFPEVAPYTGVGGFTKEPAVTFANEILQRFLAEGMPWKWNRAIVPTLLTVSLQQDYVTNVTDLGWLEFGRRIDINNTTNPKPIFGLEAVRDLGQSSRQGVPFNVAWVPNSLAIMGAWQANTTYKTGYGLAATPSSPIQQFKDANGNILFINSNSLGVDINSKGVGDSASTTPPYGTSAGGQPLAVPNAAAGTTVADGTVTWTVADPNGFAIRLTPIPAVSGLTWLVSTIYQKKPPLLTALSSTISPIPDELTYLFRAGFLAKARDLAPSAPPGKANTNYLQWEEALVAAVRSGDREREDANIFPSEGLTGGSPYSQGLPIGPAWPYAPYGGF